MSTSFSPALEAERKEPQPKSHPFSYAEAAPGGGQAPGMPSLSSTTANFDQASWEASLRQSGRAEGEAAARAVYEEHLARVRDSVRAALTNFTTERATYYRQVEAEVVQLALAIARKILHRETQVDPLLLAGVVRVALDQIEANTKVTVRVNPEQAADARAYLLRAMNSQSLPEIVEDPAVARDACTLQTELGTTELGLEAQFKEIEQGLLDLLAKRPGGEK